MPTPQRLPQPDPTEARPDLPPDTVCTERIVIPTFNAEFVPETDDGPCTKTPVLRLTIRHDGTACGCDGTCQIPDPEQPNSEPPGQWIEVRLLCADHVYEYRTDGALTARPPAITIEDVSPPMNSRSDEVRAPAQMFCRTCRRPLNTRTRAGRVEYLHAEQLRGGACDHPADPATIADLGTVVLVCDFCSAADPVWIYTGGDQETDVRVVTTAVVGLGDYQRRHRAARTVRADTEMGPLQQWGQKWTACNGCAAYLDARDIYGLIGRVVKSMAAGFRRGNRLAQTRAHLHSFYSSLFATLQPGRTAVADEHPHGEQGPARNTT